MSSRMGRRQLLVREGSGMKKWDWMVKMFDPPSSGEEYVIGGDPAGGMASSTYSVATVLRTSDMKVVCVVRDKIDPDQYAKLVEALGHVYNEAKICIERNRDGQGVNSYLMNRGYPNLYYGRKFKMRGNQVDARPGVYLGKQNRRRLLNLLQGVVREGIITVPHKKTIEEMSTFIRDEKGEGKAQEGFYDDTVFSLMYAVVADAEGPNLDSYTNEKEGNSVDPKDTTKNPHAAALGPNGEKLMWGS